MQEYKSPPERLARLFKQSRDQWKARAAQKQKRLRALEIKVRDLRTSRDYWKRQAQQATASLGAIQEAPSARPKKGGLSAPNQPV